MEVLQNTKKKEKQQDAKWLENPKNYKSVVFYSFGYSDIKTITKPKQKQLSIKNARLTHIKG